MRRTVTGLVVAVLILLGAACEDEPTTVTKYPFQTAEEFYNDFDRGFSGLDPSTGENGVPALTAFHGDHDIVCNGPDTSRTVEYDPTFGQLFWHCAPGDDPAKGHVMTAVDTLGYNIAWFSPKPVFENVHSVCFDINQTQMSNRKWWQVMFVDAREGEDATRYPAGGPTDGSGVARGSGGYDLGFTSPDFRTGVAPSTGIEPHSGTLAGLKGTNGGMFRWFQDQDNWTGEVGWLPTPGVATADKATRYKTCINNSTEQEGHVKILQWTIDGRGQFGSGDGLPDLRVFFLPGQIPQHPVRIVFQDDNYDPPKGEQYSDTALTLHWDNVEVVTKP